jgi:biotin transporter BioY
LAVAPFLLVDVVKIAVALIVARALRASGALS